MVTAECSCKNKEPIPNIENFSGENTGQNPVIPALRTSSSLSDHLQISDIKVDNVSPGGRNSSSASSESPCRTAGSGTGLITEADTSWPSPIVTSLYPDSVLAGSGELTITIDGNNFIPETRVFWDARDYTKDYLSIYQMTANIPASELGTPGQHYIWVNNPTPCGGNSNIAIFQINDNGQSFPLTTSPLTLRILKTQTEQTSFLVQNLPKGLLRYNLTLSKESNSPFSFFFSGFPVWTSDPQIVWLDINRLLIKGGDANDRIRNGTGEAILVNISIFGSFSGSGQIKCTLNEAIADDGTRYGSGYTVLPVTVGEIISFPDTIGGMFPLPTDPDRDGLFEDINGNGRVDLSDVVIIFHNIDFIMNHQPWWPFDFDQNRVINLNDVVTLFRMNSM